LGDSAERRATGAQTVNFPAAYLGQPTKQVEAGLAGGQERRDPQWSPITRLA